MPGTDIEVFRWNDRLVVQTPRRGRVLVNWMLQNGLRYWI